jgi:hypothetical protein
VCLSLGSSHGIYCDGDSDDAPGLQLRTGVASCVEPSTLFAVGLPAKCEPTCAASRVVNYPDYIRISVTLIGYMHVSSQ